jgi:TPR repeat protein
MYDKGQGVAQDYAAAVSWYRKAAEQGFSGSQSRLANMYYDGQGVAQDYAAAVSWYRKAAEQGDTRAQVNLGFMYAQGQGVVQNYIQAHKWFNLAGAGAKDAETRNNATKNRDIVAAKMQPAQIAGAQQLASEWRQK